MDNFELSSQIFLCLVGGTLEKAYWKHGNDFKCKHYAMQASAPLHKSHLVIYFTESLRDSSINQKGFATSSRIHILVYLNLKTFFKMISLYVKQS